MVILIRTLMTLGLMVTVTPAVAQITTYGTRTDFDAAVPDAEIETFDSFSFTPFNNSSVDIGPFTLATYGGDPSILFNAIVANSAPPSVNGTPYVRTVTYKQNFSDFGLDVLFDAPIFAFGADFASVGEISTSRENTVAIIVDGIRFAIPTPIIESSFFFGFTSTTSFTTVRFSDEMPDGGDVFGIDNITFRASVPAVPEPATWMMMLVGIGMIGSALRHRPYRRANVGSADEGLRRIGTV